MVLVLKSFENVSGTSIMNSGAAIRLTPESLGGSLKAGGAFLQMRRLGHKNYFGGWITVAFGTVVSPVRYCASLAADFALAASET